MVLSIDQKPLNGHMPISPEKLIKKLNGSSLRIEIFHLIKHCQLSENVIAN